jgi:hypothetical protein
MVFRTAAFAVVIAAIAASSDFATASDSCGAGWHWNGDRCVPTSDERRARDERRYDRERGIDRPTTGLDRSTTGFSRNPYRLSDCQPGFRRVEGGCIPILGSQPRN